MALAPAAVSAQTTSSPVTLGFSDALKIAGEKSPGVIMAGERVKQALERLNQTRAPLFPQLSVSASEIRQTKNLETFGLQAAPNTPSVTGPFNAFDARLKVIQTLFDMATVKRLEAAGIGHEVSRAEEKKIKEDVLALVATLYIEAKRAQSALAFSEAELRLSRETYRLAGMNFRIGTGSEMDLKNAKAAHSESRFQRRMSKTKARDTQLDLKAALGFSEEQEMRLSENEPTVNLRLPKRPEILKLTQSHPEVLLAQAKLRQAEAETASEKAEFLPKISGAADYGASADLPGHSKATYSYGLEAAWAIFEGGQRTALAAEGQSKSREAEAYRKDLTNQKENKALEAREFLKNMRNLLKAKRDDLAAQSRQLELTKNRLANGTASRLEVIHAMSNETRAADVFAEAAASFQTAEVNLAHALGQTGIIMNDRRIL
ncbi:MAG: hypothetical protein COT00_02435 [Candidatus Omnitrophica bacterium CG07_land_8_20_14_0_80_50_8]|nr:MAG: hypothetical protein COT00_02435 [Candidatus Omnitrophica bacterium CG07_land_8_20_14_0_80_50_8]